MERRKNGEIKICGEKDRGRVSAGHIFIEGFTPVDAHSVSGPIIANS